MAGGGPGASPVTDIFLARLKTDLAGVSSTLTLLPCKGNKVLVNRKLVTIPDAGMTRLVSDTMISGTGTDSGVIPVFSTIYYAYISNSRATFSPESIRLSATAPSLVSGVLYLGATLNAHNWRFVGWVRTNVTPNFEFSTSNGWICNYYNRLRLPLMANPGYLDNDAYTSYTVSSLTYVELNGGVNARVNFISNGEDETHAEGTFVVQDGPGFTGLFGLGIDATAPEQIGWHGGTVVVFNGTIHTVYDGVLSGGSNHFIALTGLSNSGAAVTVFSNVTKDGAAVSPRATMVRVFINA